MFYVYKGVRDCTRCLIKCRRKKKKKEEKKERKKRRKKMWQQMNPSGNRTIDC